MNLGNMSRLFFIMSLVKECLLDSASKKWLVCTWTFHILHSPGFFFLRFLSFILCPWSIQESTQVNWLAQQSHKNGALRQCSATPTYSKGILNIVNRLYNSLTITKMCFFLHSFYMVFLHQFTLSCCSMSMVAVYTLREKTENKKKTNCTLRVQ